MTRFSKLIFVLALLFFITGCTSDSNIAGPASDYRIIKRVGGYLMPAITGDTFGSSTVNSYWLTSTSTNVCFVDGTCQTTAGVGSSLLATAFSATSPISIATTSTTVLYGVVSGYNIPLIASTSNWQTAYGWGDHAGLYPTYGYASSTYYLATNPSGYISSYTETDPIWVASSSSYSTTATIQSTYPTYTYASSTYYLATNPSGYISSYSETDPIWVASSSLYAKLASPTFTGTINFATASGTAITATTFYGALTGTASGNPAESSSTIKTIIDATTASTTPGETDKFAFSGASILNHLTWANIKSSLKTYFDTLYQPLNSILISIGSKTYAKGDLIIATSSTQVANLAIGTDGQCLTASSSQATGLVWGTCGTSGGGSGTVGSGLTGQLPYYAADGTTLTATSTLFITTAGYVGIGTSTPNSIFGVNELIDFNNANWKTLIGYQAGKFDKGQYNTYIGYQTGFASSTASTIIADNNTAIGYQTLYSNATGYDNVAIGNNALYSNTTGYENAAMGMEALYYNTTGYSNTANGVYALYSNTTGYENAAMGYNALFSNTTGGSNSAIGRNALYSNTTGYSNTANGVYALYSSTGNNNTGMGYSALLNISGAYHNNTALGYNAGVLQADGSSNLTGSSQSVYIGSGVMGFNNSDVNSIVIGYAAKGIGANTVVLGNDSITTTALKGKVGIGTTTPTNNLDVKGAIGVRGDTANQLRLYEDGSENYIGFKASSTLSQDYSFVWPVNYGVANQMLQTDGNGYLSWVDATRESSSTIKTLFDTTTASTTPGETDKFAFSGSSILNHLTWANIKSALLTYFNTKYDPIKTATTAPSGFQSPTVTIASSTWMADKGTGTSTIPLGVAYSAETWVEIACYTDVGTALVRFGDGTNYMPELALSSTVASSSLSSNNTFTKYEKRFIQVGTFATNPNYLTCSVQKSYN